jgi:hypothetical protein
MNHGSFHGQPRAWPVSCPRRIEAEPARQARALPRHDAHGRGVFMMAKANGGVAIAAASIDHLRRYIKLLFQPALQKSQETS